MLHELPRTEAIPDSAVLTEAEAAAMAHAVVRLFERWQLSDAEARNILGGLAARTFARWKAGEIGRIDRDLATRMSLLMGIHKGLRYLFTEPERGYAWVKKPNSDFGNRAPVEVMSEGSIFALARIRHYLDAERSGW